MCETRTQVEAAEGRQRFRIGAPSVTWSMAAAVRPQKVTNFEAVRLAIAGHDLLRPHQVIQSAHEGFGYGVRTSSELRCLRSRQIAIGRLKEQLEQLLTAMRIQESTRRLELAPLRIQQVLQQACRENEHAALSKGIAVHTVSSDVIVLSDGLLLGAALGNLVSDAVKYTQSGGRVLVGCRRSGSEIRIDVTTPALESSANKFRGYSKRSLGLMAHSVTVSHRSLRAAGAPNFGPSHRRCLHSMPRVSLFDLRRPIRRWSERSSRPRRKNGRAMAREPPSRTIVAAGGFDG